MPVPPPTPGTLQPERFRNSGLALLLEGDMVRVQCTPQPTQGAEESFRNHPHQYFCSEASG